MRGILAEEQDNLMEFYGTSQPEKDVPVETNMHMEQGGDVSFTLC